MDKKDKSVDVIKGGESRSKSLIKFITCGSVDDGKSTLIGRLLFDSDAIYSDQLTDLEKESLGRNIGNKKIDFSLLVDGLSAEREQGITIDVAYRFFSSKTRKYIVLDTPGHEQYTRNMVTGASHADVAIILIDASQGILEQTKRHFFICHLLGIDQIFVAINKMDLVNYEQKVFVEIKQRFKEFTQSLSHVKLRFIPISALFGDNVKSYSSNKKLSWYKGKSILQYLDDAKLEDKVVMNKDFAMPVQLVDLSKGGKRGYLGTILEGKIEVNDTVKVLPQDIEATIDKIEFYKSSLTEAVVGQPVAIYFKEQIDCSRGSIICHENSLIDSNDQIMADLIWMDKQALVPNRSYFLKINTQFINAFISKPKYKINFSSFGRVSSNSLISNEVGEVVITTERPILFSSYKTNKKLGGFILIDKFSKLTVAAGLIKFGLKRTKNIFYQEPVVSREDRAKLLNQKPIVLWMTGISGSGKSTIASLLEKKLSSLYYKSFILDGDNLRQGLNKDLGFKEEDRVENIRRAGEVTKLLYDAGLIVIAAFISPYAAERDYVRKIHGDNEFFEIHIDTPLSVAEKRDVKGLYRRARKGEIPNFTGIDSPYEKPHSPDLIIDTTRTTAEAAAESIFSFIEKRIKF